MQKLSTLWRFVVFFLITLGWSSAVTAASQVWTLTIDDAITPASSDYFINNLDDAQQQNIDLLVLKLDTPGGLSTSMREMIQAILASDVPVVTYVSPPGARAASAGTYILYASHFAAMAPSTNVGSSTPVQMRPMGGQSQSDKKDDEGGESAEPGSAMEKKAINDAVAYLKELAQLRGRNVEWAEATVREAANLGATEALEKNVIDFIARDLDALLASLNGQEVEIGGETRTLSLDNPQITEKATDWRYELLNIITNPNVAYILLMIGVYGLILEFYNPGTGIAGITGLICLFLAGFAFQMLPVNYAGLALLVLGIVLMIGEAFNPSFGVLGIGGLAAFVIGSVLLMDSDLPGYQISVPLIAAVAFSSLLVCIFLVGAALRARETQLVSGDAAIIGTVAEAREDFTGEGRVNATGEVWHAYCATPVRRGQSLRVTAINGLVLTVEPYKESV